MSNLTELRKVELRCATDRAKRLAFNDLWRDGPCVILFLRRFHCPYAKLAAKELGKIAETLKKQNVRLIGIGSTTAGLADFLKRDYFPTSDLYLDESRRSYRLAGFKTAPFYGVATMLLSEKARQETRRAGRLGYGGHLGVGGSALQNGGVLVVDAEGGDVLYRFVQPDAMTYADNKEILEAILKKKEQGA